MSVKNYDGRGYMRMTGRVRGMYWKRLQCLESGCILSLEKSEVNYGSRIKYFENGERSTDWVPKLTVKGPIYRCISFVEARFNPSQGKGQLHGSFFPLVSVTSIFFIQSMRLGFVASRIPIAFSVVPDCDVRNNPLHTVFHHLLIRL